jgi:hypothetical protein
MIYSIALYLVFILPISIIKYKIDGKNWLIIKILNSLITLYVFALVAGNLKRLIFGLSDSSYLIMKNVPLTLNITMSVFYTILSFVVGVQVIKLSFRQTKARIFFIWLIPFLWIFTGIEKYYVYMALYNEIPSMEYNIFTYTIHTLVWLCILLFYNSNRFKMFISASTPNINDPAGLKSD